ncbi:hypothetical protein B5G20_02705 [Collinsella sp. An7]|nr:hypothetical protein B5G20_02705 [Collinsella sp. An7]
MRFRSYMASSRSARSFCASSSSALSLVPGTTMPCSTALRMLERPVWAALSAAAARLRPSAISLGSPPSTHISAILRASSGCDSSSLNAFTICPSSQSRRTGLTSLQLPQA